MYLTGGGGSVGNIKVILHGSGSLLKNDRLVRTVGSVGRLGSRSAPLHGGSPRGQLLSAHHHCEMWTRQQTELMCYGAQFSPWDGTSLAVASAEHFGIIGKGGQCVYDLSAQPVALRPRVTRRTPDGVFDCCWSERDPGIVLSACGDGSLRLWDVVRPEVSEPLAVFSGHSAEVYGVAWNLVHKSSFASASWDHSVRVWDPESPQPIRALMGHTGCVYASEWACGPWGADLIASASADRSVNIWDVRNPTPRASLSIKAHSHEVLSCDWNKYLPMTLATGSVDRLVRVWDIRKVASGPLVTLESHEFAVRKVKWSPHTPNLLLSAGYDMNVILWDWMLPNALLNKFEHHSEFVIGLDWNLFVEGQVVSCGWDQGVFVWNINSQPPPPSPAPSSRPVAATFGFKT